MVVVDPCPWLGWLVVARVTDRVVDPEESGDMVVCGNQGQHGFPAESPCGKSCGLLMKDLTRFMTGRPPSTGRVCEGSPWGQRRPGIWMVGLGVARLCNTSDLSPMIHDAPTSP